MAGSSRTAEQMRSALVALPLACSPRSVSALVTRVKPVPSSTSSSGACMHAWHGQGTLCHDEQRVTGAPLFGEIPNTDGGSTCGFQSAHLPLFVIATIPLHALALAVPLAHLGASCSHAQLSGLAAALICENQTKKGYVTACFSPVAKSSRSSANLFLARTPRRARDA